MTKDDPLFAQLEDTDPVVRDQATAALTSRLSDHPSLEQIYVAAQLQAAE